MRQVISATPAQDVAPLAARLAAGAVLVADPSRALCSHYGYQTLHEVPIELQKRLRREILRKHAEALFENASCVCDHSVFAFLADWMRWLWSQTPADQWEAVLIEAYPAVQRSERIHHVIAAPSAVYDGHRWLDADNAKQLDRLMRSLYREFGCEGRVIEVCVGP